MRFSAAFVALACLVLPAWGDVVHFKNGGSIEGQVVATPTGVIVKLPGGDIAIPSDAIARIEKKESLLEQYQQRAAAIKDPDPEAHYQLGVWAYMGGLKLQAQGEFRKTIALNPNHIGARQALGYRYDNGRWMTEDEEMQARGFVRHEGQWMTPEAASRLQTLRAELEIAREKRLTAEADLKRAQEQLRAAPPAPEMPIYRPNPYGNIYSTRGLPPYYPQAPYYPGVGPYPGYYPGYPAPYVYSPFGTWWFYPGGRRFVPWGSGH